MVVEPSCTYRHVIEAAVTDSCEYTSSRVPADPLSWTPTMHVRSASIVDGQLTEVNGQLINGGSFVGTHTSQIQAYIDSAFAPVTKSNYSNLSLVNSSHLNQLHLTGAYLCDTPLLLPSMFVLRGAGMTLTPAANLSLANVSRFSAMVMLQDVTLSAIIGGTYDASRLPPPPAGLLARQSQIRAQPHGCPD